MRYGSPRGTILVGKGARRSNSMSSSNLIRWSGLAAVMASVLLLIPDIIDAYRTDELSRTFLTTGTHAFESLLRMSALVLLLPLGLVGLYARQSEAAGPLGLLSFLVAFAGTVLVAGFGWTDTFIAPELATSAPQFLEGGPPPGRLLSFLVFGIGWLLFGVASLLARIYPSPAATLLIIGAVLSTVLSITFIPVPLGGLPFQVAVAWLGFVLFTGRGASAASERRSRVA
jgi:hypothetical protein